MIGFMQEAADMALNWSGFKRATKNYRLFYR